MADGKEGRKSVAYLSTSCRIQWLIKGDVNIDMLHFCGLKPSAA